MQGFNTAQELADALSNGTLHVCDAQEWTSLNYNDNVSRQEPNTAMQMLHMSKHCLFKVLAGALPLQLCCCACGECRLQAGKQANLLDCHSIPLCSNARHLILHAAAWMLFPASKPSVLR